MTEIMQVFFRELLGLPSFWDVLQPSGLLAGDVKESRNGTRPTIFKWWQSKPDLILSAVRWYLRYSVSLRDVGELPEERGLKVDHKTVWRWLKGYALSWSGDRDRI
jgi:hypothetical protein